MRYIDPHIHCVSRTTDDYVYMSRCGVVAVSEPAFWAGFDRGSALAGGDLHVEEARRQQGRLRRVGRPDGDRSPAQVLDINLTGQFLCARRRAIS